MLLLLLLLVLLLRRLLIRRWLQWACWTLVLRVRMLLGMWVRVRVGIGIGRVMRVAVHKGISIAFIVRRVSRVQGAGVAVRRYR
jgi:hypothetical protein